MKVTLLAHTQLTPKAIRIADLSRKTLGTNGWEVSDGQVVALAAIRQCYSHKTALEVLKTEGDKYFGEKGKEGQRLFKKIITSGHTSTLEHIQFSFAVEDVSRALLAQITRHRVGWGFSVQSQRYNKFSSDSRSGGFNYTVPEKIKNAAPTGNSYEVQDAFRFAMEDAQEWYDHLISMGVPQEDARAVLPNAANCNLVVSCNLRALLDFYSKRRPGAGAQSEIAQLAVKMKDVVIEEEPWTAEFFELAAIDYKQVAKVQEKEIERLKKLLEGAGVDATKE